MPRKTRAQKTLTKTRQTVGHVVKSNHHEPRLVQHVYHETDADKSLKQVTMRDATRTLLVTILLFAIQYIVFLRADMIRAIFR